MASRASRSRAGAVETISGTGSKLQRRTFTTNRLLEFCSRKELELQTGHTAEQWPRVVAKELGDNALDACEEGGVAPDVTFAVSTASGSGAITVTDNGLGIPSETVASILDFNVRVSSREAYVSPTRGAQGNALKTIIAMPFALDGGNAATIIESRGVRHVISLSVDAVRQIPIVTHDQEPCARKGTAVTVRWPESACSQLAAQRQQFLQLVLGYACINPHATFHFHWDNLHSSWTASDPDWTKWSPSDPTAAWWYDLPRFERLVAAYVHDQPNRTVREFVTEFRGLSGSAKVSALLATTDLTRVTLGELFQGGKPSPRISHLLTAMRHSTNRVKPADLGIIGGENFARRFGEFGADIETFEYKRIERLDDAGVPTVIEAAFAYCPKHGRRLLLTGINWSPGIVNPFRQLGAGGEGLERVLTGQRAESTDPIIVAVHLASPVITYLDRGKSAIALRGEDELRQRDEPDESETHYLPEVYTPHESSLAAAVITAVKTVTRRWTKQRKAEERYRAREEYREEALRRTRKTTQKDVAWEVMEEAYLKASSKGTLPANARQIMYAARKEIQDRTGKQLDGVYFTQVLLPDYLADKAPPWSDKVVYDDRGHLREPHTGRSIGLGTLNVRNYLDRTSAPQLLEAFEAKIETFGPASRYGGVLFIEKEGFDPLFRQGQPAERHDLALMSTKGLSVTAARLLADHMCAKYGIPLFVLRDFDKAGFSGVATFERDGRRYQYENEFDVIDLGLRFKDVRCLGIEDQAENTFDRGSEDMSYRFLPFVCDKSA